MALETYRIYHIVDDSANICNKQICVETDVDADLGYRMWCGRDNTGIGPKTGVITKWLAKDQPARVTSLNISGLTAVASLVKTDGLGNLSAGQITIATLNSFLSDGPIPICPVITAGQMVYGGGSAGTPITSKSSFFFDSANNYLGIGHATPDCGLHLGANNPAYSSGASDAFITGDLEVNNIDLINTIRAHNFTTGSIPYLSGSPVAMNEANSNLYYTSTTFGVKVTPTDDNATLDIVAAPVYSATGGDATINIIATATGTGKNSAINLATTPGGAGQGDIDVDSGDDLTLHAAQVVNITSATNKAHIKLYPTANGEIRFSSAYIYANYTKTYLPLSESSTEEVTYASNYGEVSILNALNQVYTLASGAGSVEPAGQVVYGTGTGIDSEANFHWDATNDELTITKSVNKTNWYDADAAAIKLTGTATQGQVVFSDQDLIVGNRKSVSSAFDIWSTTTGASSNAILDIMALKTVAGSGQKSEINITSEVTGGEGTLDDAYVNIKATGTAVGSDAAVSLISYVNSVEHKLAINAASTNNGEVVLTNIAYVDFNGAKLADINNAAWGAPTTAGFATNTITANFSTGKDIQEVSLTAAATTLALTAPTGGAAKGLQIICYASGADRDVGGGAGFNGVHWDENMDLATTAKTIPSGKYGIICLTYDDSNWFGTITVFA